SRRAPAALRTAQAKLGDADRTAKAMVRDAEIQARSEVLTAREAFEASVKEQRRELNETLSSLNRREQVLSQREDNMDRKADVLDRKADAIEKKAAAAEAAATEAREKAAEAAAVRSEAEARLEKLAGMTRDEARKDLVERATRDVQGQFATILRRRNELAKKEADGAARNLILGAMQRYAGSMASENTVSTVQLPEEDAKGRIIGREGRNIRALEAATGCSFLMDDTPGTVVVSAPDPARREIAVVALKRLIASGRIQPQRVEEVVEEVRRDWDAHLAQLGGAAADEAGAAVADPEILRALGRLSVRTSYSQNVLRHSVETARYAGMLASELGMDDATARRVGLLHDIGKALDETHEGPHATIGAEFLRARGEPQEVVDAVAGHHGGTENETEWAVLASVADAISSARPGARSESGDLYLKRIESLEGIARSFPGVSRAFAVQAGRDLRVLVDPEKTTDQDALSLASRIAERIEQEVKFPGQIRVTVIREKRCVEFAR
ncbi:MAG: ribonuclease Y, partial [Kiritimatiellae bacterium]|nr:ribonuclease Y [Kiritimatiellia bacterium]